MASHVAKVDLTLFSYASLPMDKQALNHFTVSKCQTGKLISGTMLKSATLTAAQNIMGGLICVKERCVLHINRCPETDRHANS